MGLRISPNEVETTSCAVCFSVEKIQFYVHREEFSDLSYLTDEFIPTCLRCIAQKEVKQYAVVRKSILKSKFVDYLHFIYNKTRYIPLRYRISTVGPVPRIYTELSKSGKNYLLASIFEEELFRKFAGYCDKIEDGRVEFYQLPEEDILEIGRCIESYNNKYFDKHASNIISSLRFEFMGKDPLTEFEGMMLHPIELIKHLWSQFTSDPDEVDDVQLVCGYSKDEEEWPSRTPIRRIKIEPRKKISFPKIVALHPRRSEPLAAVVDDITDYKIDKYETCKPRSRYRVFKT